jgi:hypothetical protein
MDHASLHYFCARQSDFVGSELSCGHHRDFGGDGKFGSYTAILSADRSPRSSQHVLGRPPLIFCQENWQRIGDEA